MSAGAWLSTASDRREYLGDTHFAGTYKPTRDNHERRLLPGDHRVEHRGALIVIKAGQIDAFQTDRCSPKGVERPPEPLDLRRNRHPTARRPVLRERCEPRQRLVEQQPGQTVRVGVAARSNAVVEIDHFDADLCHVDIAPSR